MVQYQSFPGVPGDSHSFDKLQALQFPDLGGKRFLDVGCNEGFFCGFALFAGARRVVGLDQSADFIARAQKRFPDAQFLCQSWDHLPPGPFDVILLASALHYASDQPELIRRLTDALTPEGILVLELGIAPGDTSEWREVDRGIDKRKFPTWPQLGEMLSPYAWKLRGDSVQQKGDPIPRRVIHISRRKPTAYLLMQQPGHGKSTVCRQLFGQTGIRVIQNDILISAIARGTQLASPALTAAITQHFASNEVDKAILAVARDQLTDELVTIWIDMAQRGDFALDGYVPETERDAVRRSLREEGYLVVSLDWDHPSAPFQSRSYFRHLAESYLCSLPMNEHDSGVGRPERLPPHGIRGYIDKVTLVGRTLHIDGWAVNSLGRAPAEIHLSIANTRLNPTLLSRTVRADIQDHLQARHALYGFRATFALPKQLDADALRGSMIVSSRDFCDDVACVLPMSPGCRFMATADHPQPDAEPKAISPD